jgi:TolB-like protein/DNA-binding winged helix-turn-helix (wHTH) protein
MNRPTRPTLRIGAWRVDPASDEMSREGGETVRVEARTMRLLLFLADRPGEVVSIEELLEQVWPGVIVTSDSVYQAVASLRRMLGDDARQPGYIATVPRLGYRMVAAVSPWVDPPIGPAVPSPAPTAEAAAVLPADGRTVVPRRRAGVLLVAGGVLFAGLIGALAFRAKVEISQPATPAAVTAPAPSSVAVLPFLDLTDDAMSHETFADGMTEELIDRLSKIPSLRVPGPTSSFYFKGKKVTVADIAKALGVTYVLDGSLRKSGARLRVAARLIRADTGYVVWAETYDQPFDDILKVQDDIAGRVTASLKASIGAGSHHDTSQ